MFSRTHNSIAFAVFTDFFGLEVETAGVGPTLRAIRQHLGMDVAFLTRFREDDRIFEQVDSEGDAPIKVGQVVPLEHGYCLRVVRGELPQLIPDTSRLAAARALPETALIPIGAHLSVPVVLKSGYVYGTLCCFSHLAQKGLNKTDLGVLAGFASVLAEQVESVPASLTVQKI